MSAEPFTYRVRWSAEHRDFVGTCDEFPSLSWLAPTRAEALDGVRNLVEHVVAEAMCVLDAAGYLVGERSEKYALDEVCAILGVDPKDVVAWADEIAHEQSGRPDQQAATGMTDG